MKYRPLGRSGARVSEVCLGTTVILGVRTLAQFEDGLQAVELSLPSELAFSLGEVSSPALTYPYDFL